MIVQTMEVCESDDDSGGGGGGADDKTGERSHELLWERLSCQLIFFTLFQFVRFPHIVLSLYDKVSDRTVAV